MKNDLFKVRGVHAPVQTRELPVTWIVNVCGESADGRFVVVPLEFEYSVHADATLFGISKLMDKTDIWLSVPPSIRKEHLLVRKIRHLLDFLRSWCTLRYHNAM